MGLILFLIEENLKYFYKKIIGLITKISIIKEKNYFMGFILKEKSLFNYLIINNKTNFYLR